MIQIESVLFSKHRFDVGTAGHPLKNQLGFCMNANPEEDETGRSRNGVVLKWRILKRRILKRRVATAWVTIAKS